MKFKPFLAGELSGSMGAITASHNKGGPYFRNRIIPVNPASPAQTLVRSLMGQFASRWGNTLTVSQRDAWQVYADNVPLLNDLGESKPVTALNMYQRSNIPRVQNGLAIVDDGPVVFNLGDFTPPVINSYTAPTAMSLGFTEADDWVSEDGAAMLVYGSRNTAPTINFFKGPYRKYETQLLGDSAAPPTSAFAGVNPFTVTPANKAFIKVAVTRADGRYSLITRLEAIAA